MTNSVTFAQPGRHCGGAVAPDPESIPVPRPVAVATNGKAGYLAHRALRAPLLRALDRWPHSTKLAEGQKFAETVVGDLCAHVSLFLFVRFRTC